MLVYNWTGNDGGTKVLDYQKMLVNSWTGNNGVDIVLHYQEMFVYNGTANNEGTFLVLDYQGNISIQWNR